MVAGNATSIASASPFRPSTLEPALGAFGLLDPQPQHFLSAIGPDAQRQIHGLVPDRTLIADLQAQCIEVDDWVHDFQRALLPLLDFGQHLVGNGGNQIGRNLQAVQLQQMRLDFAHAHAACIHADHMIVKARQTALIFGHQLRLESGQPVAGDVQVQFAGGGDDRLRA